jgi:protein gp37
MGDITTISWTNATYNPWLGCQKVGPGCDNCYAEARDVRFEGGIHWGPGAPRRQTALSTRNRPRRWQRDAVARGVRLRVFCASLADVFDNAVDPQWRRELAAMIRETPDLDWMLLTKRIGNVPKMVERDFDGQLPRNVWLGASIVTQEEADRDIAKLLEVDAAVRWLSMEPLLERVRVAPDMMAGLDMIVVGGESGPRARSMELDWAYDLLDQARAGDTAFHFKQMSEADRPKDYWDVDAFPADLRIREFPAGTYEALPA